jgi:hypothetical protein
VYSAGPLSGFQLVLLQLRFRIPATVTDRTQLTPGRMAVLPLPSVVIHSGPGNTRGSIPVLSLTHIRIVSRGLAAREVSDLNCYTPRNIRPPARVQTPMSNANADTPPPKSYSFEIRAQCGPGTLVSSRRADTSFLVYLPAAGPGPSAPPRMWRRSFAGRHSSRLRWIASAIPLMRCSLTSQVVPTDDSCAAARAS